MIIIVGKNGYIAKRLALSLRDFISTSVNNVEKCHVLDLKSPQIFNYELVNSSTFVLLLASISSPDVCKNEYGKAYNVNVVGTKIFIGRCLEKAAKVLFFSSDTVYGEKYDTVNENSPLSPISEYAFMKKEVEDHFKDEKNFKVFRLSYVFSKEDKFTKYLLSCLKKGDEAEIFDPFDRSVVYIQDVIDAIIEIENRWDKFDNQIFNICGNELISRKDMASYFKEINGGRLKYTVTRPNESFFLARPKVINMKSLYLDKLIGRKPYTIKKAMEIEFRMGVINE